MFGDNYTENDGWKLISQFVLEPGVYTLTGMREAEENSIAFQLRLCDETGKYQYIYQWNREVTFTVFQESSIALHARVFPFTEEIDIKARPAVYRDE